MKNIPPGVQEYRFGFPSIKIESLFTIPFLLGDCLYFNLEHLQLTWDFHLQNVREREVSHT